MRRRLRFERKDLDLEVWYRGMHEYVGAIVTQYGVGIGSGISLLRVGFVMDPRAFSDV